MKKMVALFCLCFCLVGTSLSPVLPNATTVSAYSKKVYTTCYCTLYKQPSTASTDLVSLSSGNKVTVLSSSSVYSERTYWRYCSFGGKKGYIKANCLEL